MRKSPGWIGLRLFPLSQGKRRRTAPRTTQPEITLIVNQPEVLAEDAGA